MNELNRWVILAICFGLALGGTLYWQRQDEIEKTKMEGVYWSVKIEQYKKPGSRCYFIQSDPGTNETIILSSPFGSH